jgi:hypothetical protein
MIGLHFYTHNDLNNEIFYTFNFFEIKILFKEANTYCVMHV